MADKFSWRAGDLTPEEQAKIDAFVQDKLDRVSAAVSPAEFMSELGFVPLGESTAPVEEERPCGKETETGPCCGGHCG